jgi:hypothetical protein
MCLNLVCFKNFALLYRRVGAGAGATETGAGAHQNFYPELEVEPHKNDAANCEISANF